MDAFFDEDRGNVLALARGEADELMNWGLDLLSDMEFAKAETERRGS